MCLKILHVLASLEQGGIENWLVNLTAAIKEQHGNEIVFEFLTFFSNGGKSQAQLESIGCKVHHCQLAWKRPLTFIVRLGLLLHREQYDVVHCHADYISGIVLPVAHLVGVRRRVGHVHATRFAFQNKRPLLRYLAGRVLRRAQVFDGGVCIGTSGLAIDSYLGSLKVKMENRVCVCGIPCTCYRALENTPREAFRTRLGWQKRCKVVLHVGRHCEAKNLFFLLDVVAELISIRNNVFCVLVGSGPETRELKRHAVALGISDSVQFLGNRDDVPQLMKAADLLLLPSLFEGLGLVVVEAQASGLPSLVSEIVPVEANIVNGLVNRLPLHYPPVLWAEVASRLLDQPMGSAKLALEKVESSSFNIQHAASDLIGIYRSVQ